MNPSTNRLAAILVLAGLLLGAAPAAAQTQQHAGSLGVGDPKLDDGSYFDTYYVDARAGQTIVVTLTSGDFDAYLMVYDPSGQPTTDDDSGGGTNARVEITGASPGQYRVVATTLRGGETGGYSLSIALGAAAPAAGVAQAGAGGLRERGTLGPGDQKMGDGSYFDTYYVDAQAGQMIDVLLTSSDFDTYLTVYSPSGSHEEDDDDGGGTNSRIQWTAPETGQYVIRANSLMGGATGAYELVVTLGGGAAGTQAAAQAGGGAASTIRQSGSLGAGDPKMSDGAYYDSYYVDVQAGQTIDALLTSSDFDAYLIVNAPSGAHESDDDGGGGTNARVRTTASETGQYWVQVTSLTGGVTGSYDIVIEVGGGARPSTGAGPTGAGPTGAGQTGAGPTGAGQTGTRVERGTLGSGDRTLTSGEFADYYEVSGTAGEQIVVDLRATGFDPYLILKRPTEGQFDNDDYEGSSTRSLLSMALPETGTYEVIVTSYAPGEAGSYELSITQGSALAAGTGGPRVERGRLETTDRTLTGGEYFDQYTFTGQPGQTVHLDLASDAFDTFLILKSPGGEQVENDDAEGHPGHSIIAADLKESGTYTVGVTSYAPGSTGAYELTIALGAASAAPPTRQQDVSALAFGERVSGRLEAGDLTLESGEFQDIYVFDGRPGQNAVVEMSGTDFDTYLALVTPRGEAIQNDDFEGSSSRSRIELTLPEAGRYRIVATSYAAGQTGAYSLSLAEGSRTVAQAPSAGGGANVYGVFVGISDYGGRANDLAYTAEDATLVRDALVRGAGMRPENGIVLTDRAATVAGFRQAVQTLSPRMGPNDLFVFFFSGHGGRYDRAGGFQPSDPDGVDESLEFFDAEILDDDFSAILDGVRAGRQLLVVDACFSGGFAKDVISKPGRMGLFSSEEDVTSNVAAKFRAGGYLSQFFAEAVGDGMADDDGDGQIAAIELSQYVYERYRGEVKSASSDNIVIASSRQMGYQKLVVDRGSIGPYDTLFRKR